jgi:hypothetical protein
VAAGLRAAEVYEAPGELWELTGVLAFVEYQHRTLAMPEPTAAHAARLAGPAARVGPMAERLGHLGAEFLVVASRSRIEGIYQVDLAIVERLVGTWSRSASAAGCPGCTSATSTSGWPPTGPGRPRRRGGRDRRGPAARAAGGRQDQLDRNLEHASGLRRGPGPGRSLG